MFGACDENFEYLINIIKNPKHHFRVIESALSLLSHFSISGKEDELINFFKEILKNNSIINSIKSETLRTIKELNLTNYNKILLNETVAILKDNDDKRTCRNVLDLINLEDNVDAYFEFIHLEFNRYHGVLKRKTEDKTFYGAELLLNIVLLKINNGDNFIELLTIYFLNYKRHKSKFTENIINKTINIIIKDKSLIIKLYNAIEKKNLFHSNYKVVFKKIVEKSYSRQELYNYLINNIDLRKLHNLSHFVSSDDLEITLDMLQGENIILGELEQFRNLIGYCNSRTLAKEFEDLLESKNIILKEKFQTEKDEGLIAKKAKEFSQSNFDILFDKNILKEEISKIFKNNNNVITEDYYTIIENNWWDENLHFSSHITSNAYSIISHILYDENNSKDISLTNTLDIIEKHDIIRIKFIIDNINSNNGNYKFEIKENHLDDIKNWCNKTILEINFEEVLHINENNYRKIKFIHFFKEKLNIEVPVEFLINTIPYYKLDSFNETERLNEIKEWINDEELFHKQIISDVQNNRVPETNFNDYIEYAIKHRLTELTSSIEKYFREKSYINPSEFEKFISNFNLVHTLKEYCIDPNSMIFWAAINLIFKSKIDQDFCIDKALEYLKTEEFNYKQDALNILFVTNHKQAISSIIDLIAQQKSNENELHVNIENYNHIENPKDIIKLYEVIYSNQDLDRFRSHHYKSLLSSYIKNISREKGKYLITKNELENIKNMYGRTEDNLFEINFLIDESNNSYIASLSKPMSFKNALSFVNNNL